MLVDDIEINRDFDKRGDLLDTVRVILKFNELLSLDLN